MKAIINNKRYNTETAKLVGEAHHSYPGDFSHWSAGLYRTPRGNYFLAGTGGPMSRYGHSCGQNSWSGGSKIITLSKQDALEWAQAHLESDEIESAFADSLEDA